MALGAVAIFFVATVSLRGLASFYTDFLWFDSLGHSNVFTSVLGAQVVLIVLFAMLFFGILFGNLVIAERLAPPVRPPGPEEDLLVHYHLIVGSRGRLLRLGVSGLFALIAGLGVSGRWQEWLLYTNRVDFGTVDAQFGRDIGFFVFQLPLLTFVVG